MPLLIIALHLTTRSVEILKVLSLVTAHLAIKEDLASKVNHVKVVRL